MNLYNETVQATWDTTETANFNSIPQSPPLVTPTKTVEPPVANEFVPLEPVRLQDTDLSEGDIEALILKQLLTLGPRTGREIAKQLRLPFSLVTEIIQRLKNQMYLGYRSDAIAGDYQYELSPTGSSKAGSYMSQCTYCGAAPIGLNEYRQSILHQTIRNRVPTLAGLKQAYADMMMGASTIGQIGQAISAGRGMFLYGAPGNGKTSIAERAMSVLGDAIWIPRSLAIHGQIIRLFDSNCHNEMPLEGKRATDHDQRWVRIQRPTVVVGGELDFHHLELTRNPVTGICESPIQLKSNCGCLVIDDFGRQRISVAELLNRWIIPLEKGYDILNLPSGSNVQVPFDQLMVFATNLEPNDLCDEAFMRRIPYKIEVYDPSQEQFKALFLKRAALYGIECLPEMVDYLLDRHYRRCGRALRFCQVEDILQQIMDFCRFHHQPLAVDRNRIDIAALNYFGKG